MNEKLYWDKVKKTKSCWFWTGGLINGYGQFKNTKTSLLAHRIAYELLVGNIPQGKEVDHLCRNRNCVNPEHLELVSHAENVRRGSRAESSNSPNQDKYRSKKFLLYIQNERFANEPKKSALVTRLLDEYYGNLEKLSRPSRMKPVSSNDIAEGGETVTIPFIKRQQDKSSGFCKNGHSIPIGRDKCMGKGCKWGA